MKKAKAKLKELTSRNQGSRNVRKVMENIKVYIRGWLGYFGMASMKNNDTKVGRVAKTETSCLHLEAIENSESENMKPDETGHAEVLCP